jgi:hypothetical protein
LSSLLILFQSNQFRLPMLLSILISALAQFAIRANTGNLIYSVYRVSFTIETLKMLTN